MRSGACALVLASVLATSALAAEETRQGDEPPLGYAGRPRPLASESPDDFVPIEDRWRLGLPKWDRYPGLEGEYPFRTGRWWNPYEQNVLKGDYPVLHDDLFFVFSAISDTLLEGRSLPTPSGVSTERQEGNEEFFGRSEQIIANENLILSFELFEGNTAFKPRDWEIRLTPVFNVSWVELQERNLVNIDPVKGTSREDGHIALQEAFVEYHLADLSPWYDFVSSRTGIQAFASDFRGFIFSDNNLGFRLFGNRESNRQQYNLAYFRPLEKDTNSGLNRVFVNDAFDSREQDVVIANYYRQDTIWYGYTTSFSFHWNRDHADHVHFDDNRALVRPAAIGTIVRGAIGEEEPVFHDVDAYYLGWTGEGHAGRLNVSHAFYQVLGEDELNPVAGQKTDLNAQMAALELSVDRDWVRFRGSFLWASGDGEPTDDTARGFDTILDNTILAGSGFSYWNRQGIALTQTRVLLVNRFSVLPSLRSSKTEGQPSFVNPGLFLYNVGTDLDVTPKLKAFVNLSYLEFAQTDSLEFLLRQRDIDRSIGLDYSLGIQYRPLLIDNVILVASGAALTPFEGFQDIYRSETLFSGFLGVTLVY